jgi:hypothetical protein
MAAAPLLVASRPLALDTVSEAAEFFQSQLGRDGAAEYIKGMLSCLTPSMATSGPTPGSVSGPVPPPPPTAAPGSNFTNGASLKRSRIEEESPVTAADHDAFSIDTLLVRDVTDSLPMTTVLQIPEEVTLISFIIGKGGCNLSLITSLTGCKIQIEKLGTRPTDSIRHIMFLGTVASTFQAVVQVSGFLRPSIVFVIVLLVVCYSQILQRASTYGNASALEHTKIVVPNEMVSRIIGKAGSEIKKLTELSGVQKIDVGRSCFLSALLC